MSLPVAEEMIFNPNHSVNIQMPVRAAAHSQVSSLGLSIQTSTLLANALKRKNSGNLHMQLA